MGRLQDKLMSMQVQRFMDKQAAGEAADVYSQYAGAPEQISDVHTPDTTALETTGDTLPLGASPFGLMNVEQRTQPATGLFSDDEDKWLNYSSNLMASGDPMAQQTGLGFMQDQGNSYNDLQAAQQKSDIADESYYARAAYDAANTPIETGLEIKDLTGINNKVTDMLKQSDGIYRGAKQLEGLKGSGSPASQIAAVFSFMKSIDPTSTVRESELGMVYSAEGAAKGIAAQLSKMAGQGGLSESNFADLVDTAKIMSDTSRGASKDQLGGFINVYGDKMTDKTRTKIMSRLSPAFNKDLASMSIEELEKELTKPE